MGTIRIKEPPKEMLDMAMTKTGRSSIGMENSVGEYFYINLDRLIPFKNQARQSFDKGKIEGLAISIKEYGIRQPLTVVKSIEHEGKFEIVSGECRVRAAKLIGLDSVPCIIISDYSKAESIAIIENIHRSDLHPVELAKAYNSLLQNNSYSSGVEVAASLGVSKSAFYEALQILKLPEVVQQSLIENGIRSREKIRLLLKSENPLDTLNNMINPKPRSGYCRSILRIGFEKGEFLIQKDNLFNLKDADKNRLKIILNELINNL